MNAMNINRLVSSVISLLRVNYIVILNNDLRKLIIETNPNYKTKKWRHIEYDVVQKNIFTFLTFFYFFIINDHFSIFFKGFKFDILKTKLNSYHQIKMYILTFRPILNIYLHLSLTLFFFLSFYIASAKRKTTWSFKCLFFLSI